MGIYAVKTTASQERTVADMIMTREDDRIHAALAPDSLTSYVMVEAEGDIVELIAGPFKGEKAQVQRIDEGNDQVTVELYEATVPIPVTVRGDQIRVLDSEER